MWSSAEIAYISSLLFYLDFINFSGDIFDSIKANWGEGKEWVMINAGLMVALKLKFPQCQVFFLLWQLKGHPFLVFHLVSWLVFIRLVTGLWYVAVLLVLLQPAHAVQGFWVNETKNISISTTCNWLPSLLQSWRFFTPSLLSMQYAQDARNVITFSSIMWGFLCHLIIFQSQNSWWV